MTLERKCWTAVFAWSYCSLKLQILRLFRARSSKTVKCRFTLKCQKQLPEVFCKKRCSEKFRKIHRKTHVPEPFFKKETLEQVFSCEFCKISKNTCFREHLQTTASVKVNVLTFGRVCWRHSASCCSYDFLFQVISERTLCAKEFNSNLRGIFIRK